jgi:ribosomal protein S27AE
MSDYISRDAAKQILSVLLVKDAAECACNLIDSVFPADVEPVRHGRWEPGNQICPVCGEDKFKDLDADIWSDWTPPCCPNCGAKMELEDENGT